MKSGFLTLFTFYLLLFTYKPLLQKSRKVEESKKSKYPLFLLSPFSLFPLPLAYSLFSLFTFHFFLIPPVPQRLQRFV